jgi:hypothetical protein
VGPPRDGRGRGANFPGLESRNYTATNGTATNGGTAILPDADDARRRQVRRLATIELTRILYGPVADLPASPPGPAVCPASCRYCSRRRAA